MPYDEKIYKETAGRIGDSFESAIRHLSFKNNKQITPQFGALLPLKSILLSKERAINMVMKIAKKYWGNVDLFLFEKLQDTSIDLNYANDRLSHFFNSAQGAKALFQYLTIHHKLRFDHLISLVFGKEIELTNHVGGLDSIYFYKVEKRYFIHTIYNHDETFWKMLFVKKVYSIFLQTSVLSIDDSLDLMKQLKVQLEQLLSVYKSVYMINELVKEVGFINPSSFQLKELHIFNVTNHYKGGKRHRQKLTKIIEDIYRSWGEGQWALTEKEQTILSYMLAIDSYNKGDFERTITYGEYLIEQDRLNNHAIELILEYGEVLPNIKPEPTTLIKPYNKNYLEKVFFMLIDAYIHKNQYKHVIRLLKDYEIASCTAIYNYFNNEEFEENSLHLIEAAVQRDLIFIVDQSPQHVIKSIEVWLTHYQSESSPYYEIAVMSSKHISNILKALFATEHFDLFDKLMEIYKKYLKLDQDFNELREFVAEYV